MLKGALTALVTPFKDGVVDENRLRGLIERQISAGINGLVPCGSTGESATLTHAEHKRVIDITVETAGGRVPVLAGTGSNSTAETIILTNHAKAAGADACLLITPYYNKPSQEGLFRHYERVAAKTDIPIVLYNVPSRTAVNMTPQTTGRLSRIDSIIGIKEASGNLEQVSETLQSARDGFIMLSGDDADTLPILCVGGHGVISVTSNLVPADVVALCNAFEQGRVNEARDIHKRLLRLSIVMFIETNPVPVKTALSMMGLASEDLRLPLVGMGEISKKRLKDVLMEFGLIE